MRKEVFNACLNRKVKMYYFNYENSTLTLVVSLVKIKTNYQAVLYRTFYLQNLNFHLRHLKIQPIQRIRR